METVGTIVGTLSLGITICDGIIKYCRSWKNQDDDVRALTALTTRLKQLLEILDQRLQPNSAYNPIILQRVKSSVQDCTGHINSVIHLSDKYKAGQTSGLKGKAKDMMYKLKFPFEKQALDDLRDIMVAFRGNVDTALQILTMDLTVANLDAVQNVQRENSDMHTRTIGHMQNNSTQITQSLTQEFAQRLPPLEESIKSSLSRQIDCSTASIESTVESAISQSMVVINSGMQSSLTLHQKQIDIQQEQSHQLQTVVQLLAKFQPAQELEEDCHTLLSQSIGSGSRRKIVKRRLRSLRENTTLCNCNPTAGTKDFYSPFWGGFRKQQEKYIIHDRTCPMWYASRTETSYQVNCRIFQKFGIFGSVQVGRSPYATIPGLSITQNLSCAYVVPWDAPSFRVLDWYLSKPQRFVSSEYCISSCVRDLRLIFQSGRGSPRDCLKDGCNLLDRAFTRIQKNYGNFSAKLLLLLARDLMGMGIEFREGELGSINSFPQNMSPSSIISQQIFYGTSPSVLNTSPDIFDFSTREALDLILCLSKEGIDFFIHSRWHWSYPEKIMHAWNGFKIVLTTLRQNEDFAAIMECGELSMAVLAQNITAVKRILQEQPGLLKAECNICGHTAIHLAIGWPEGLEILLAVVDESIWKAMSDKDYRLQIFEGWDSELHTPLDYAIGFGCVQSIKLLADADFDFNFSWNVLVGTKSLDPAISNIVIALILERYRQLHDFALQKLPAEFIREFEIQRFEIFDSKARAVLQYFQANNIHMTRKFRGYQNFWGNHYSEEMPCFCPDFGGIFHQRELHPETAKAFFDAGVLSIDCEVEQLTPLMIVRAPKTSGDRRYHFSHFARFFGIVEFLASKGACLDKEIHTRYIEGECTIDNDPLRKHRVIHQIASLCWENVLGDQLGAFTAEDIVMVARLGSTRKWCEILSDIASDPCDCACSSGGCRPVNLALKNSFRLWGRKTAFCLGERNRRFKNDLAFDWVLLLLENLGGQNVDEDVVRFLTFSALELTHTCCRHSSEFYPHRKSHPHRNSNEWKMIYLTDVAEVREIRNEEAPLIDRLDCLVNEFMELFRELTLPLTVFLREHWKPRMQTELLEKDVLSQAEIERFKDLGVEILDDDEADTENDDSPKLDNGRDSYDEWIESIMRSFK